MKRFGRLLTQMPLFFGCLLFTFSAVAKTGDSPKNAKGLSVSSTLGALSAVLVDEYDADFKENTGSAVYYFRVTLKKGQSYTFWTTGATENATLGLDFNLKEGVDAWVGISPEQAKDGYNAYAVLRDEEWDEDDPGSVTFYGCVSGDEIGQSFTLNYQQGVVEDDSGILGSEGKPQRISVTEKETLLQGRGLEDTDSYCYQTANLNAGEKYYFAVASTNDSIGITFSIPSEGSELDFNYQELPTTEEGTMLYEVVPTASGSLLVTVDCEGPYAFRFWKLGAATPAEHDFTDYVQKDGNRDVTLSERVRDSTCMPLYRNNTDKTHKFDNVTDQALYRFKLARNIEYRFVVSGVAATNVTLDVFNAHGAVVATGTSATGEETLTVYYRPAQEAYYWVGVCQTHLDAATGELDKNILPVDMVCEFSAMPVSDAFDPKDDTPSGATRLNFGRTGAIERGRTLCGSDTNDWFTFTGAEGSYYRFELSGVEGAPRMAVFGPNNWTNACAYVLERDEAKAVQVCAAKKGTYYVRVAHANADSPEDSTYTLTASMATPGVVKLAKTALTVKDSAGHADISVSRTGRDGRVRVAFRTEGAQSDRADAYYYPTNGVLEWADGDNKAKTVRVRLAPDAAWHDARTVKLVLSAIPEDDDDFRPSGEYVAAFPVDAKTGVTNDTATITMTSAAKAAPGTVQLAGAATPKRPVVDVEAGKTVTLTLERTGGADGLIAVTATTVRGTANKAAGLDYDETEETFTWKDGETRAQTLTIQTKAVKGDHTAKKTFTVKLAAKTGKDADGTAYARPTLAAASVTVNILNEKFASAMADFAKTLPKDGGVAVREGKAGTWFVAADGSFFASPAPADLTFTLDGPGRFTYRAAGEATNRVAYVAAGKKTVAVKGVAGIDAYTWEPLPAAAPLAPTWDKAVLRAGPATLAFAQAAGVSYRVYLLNAAERGVKLGDAATEVPAPYAVELAADAKYTWRVDSYFEGGTVTNTPKKAWALATLGADAPGTPVADGADAWGKPIAYDSASAAATNIALRVGVKAEIAVADDTATAVKSVAGTLPTGLKVEQDRTSKAWFIRGVPTKAGAFEALVQATYRDEATRKAVPGTTTAFGFDVAPLGAAAGTFNGLAATSDTTNGAPRLASIALTAAATGKLSAKVQIAGKSYTFAAAGYEVAEQEADGSVRLQAELENVAKVKVGEGREAVTVTVTNTLRCALLASATNTAAVWRDEPQVDIAFAALPDAKGAGFQEDVWYSGRIVRDGAKITDRTELAAWQAEAAAFAGYYTVSLPVAAITDAPRGSGYLTLTLDAKGKAKVAGLLADGTRYTGSATCSLAEEDGAAVARVPVFAAKATTAFGGWLTLRVGADGVPVVSASLMGDDLLWVNDEPKATREGLEGFETTLHPVGGWYDTVLNLQRAYLESDLSVSLPEGDEALEEIRELMALPEGYAFKARPDGTPVTLNGDKMEVEKQKFVTGSDRLKVWEASVNAANVKITFNRKTGLVNGSFDLWYEGVNARGVKEQKSVSGLKHNGVVLLARDPDDGTLDPDVLSSGFFLAPLKVTDTTGARPTTRTWNASYRFDINAVWSERNWQDASAGE